MRTSQNCRVTHVILSERIVSIFTPTPEEILRDWHLLGVLWLLEDPAFTHTHVAAIKQAIVMSGPADIEFLCEMATVPNPEIRAQAARDLRTPAPVLWQLGRDESQNVRGALTSNFHAPLPLLQRLALDADAWIAERARITVQKRLDRDPRAPNKPADFDHAWTTHLAFLTLLRDSSLSDAEFADALSHAVDHPDWHWYAGDLCGYWRLPVAVLQKVAQHPHIAVLARLLNRPSLPDALLEEIGQRLERTQTPDTHKLNEAKVRLCLQQNAPADLLAAYAYSNDIVLMRQVAQHPRLPTDALAHIAQSSHWHLREEAAKNPALALLPDAVTERLWQDQIVEVRVQIAKNLYLRTHLLEKLHANANNWERFYLSLRPDLSANTLALLAQDRNPRRARIRRNVAQHQNAHVIVLEWLAKDREPMVRAAVARNPKTPPEILAMLLNDPHKDVRKGLIKNPNGYIIPNTPMYAQLAQDPENSVRKTLARIARLRYRQRLLQASNTPKTERQP